MSDFWCGFEKRAEEQGKSWLAPALGAAAAGLGTYGMLRAGPKTRLVKTVMKSRPKGTFGKLTDRLLHGADELVYTPTTVGAKVPKKPRRMEGTVLYENPEDAKRVIGDRSIGALSKKTQKGFDDKFKESKLLNAVAPEYHMRTELGGPMRSLKDNAAGDYFLKERGGMASGVGGGGFLQKADIQKHLAGKKLPRKQEALVRHYKKDPSKFIQQEKIDILKSPLTKQPRELRVHVVDGEVVRGATMPRGGNVEDYLSAGKAEAAMREAVKNMPASHKKNLTMAADVAMTPSGPKILELNRGAHQSGLLDPHYLYDKYKANPLAGAGAAAAAARANQNVYRHITGRHSELGAGAKALGAAAGTGAFIRSRERE